MYYQIIAISCRERLVIMAGVMLPEEYLKTLKQAIAAKKKELEELELAYAKISKALIPEPQNKEDADKIKRQKLAEAQRQHHKRRRKEMADRIIKEIPNWQQYKPWELAREIGATLDAINKIFEEDERFKK